jgi:GNAT superfamily N-acetyltransferase
VARKGSRRRDRRVAVTEELFHLRVAEPSDVSAIAELIERSVRGLSRGFYSDGQVASALRHVFGVDSQLIADGSYYVVEHGDALVAAGGWSGRQTLFGGDQMKSLHDTPVDPATNAARIRAFFVDPEWARRGLGRRLYEACERAAAAAGFLAFELVATMPGVPLYRALGFEMLERFVVPMPDGSELPVARMSRRITSDAMAARRS